MFLSRCLLHQLYFILSLENDLTEDDDWLKEFNRTGKMYVYERLKWTMEKEGKSDVTTHTYSQIFKSMLLHVRALG